jgi:signal peptide peptidase SppA
MSLLAAPWALEPRTFELARSVVDRWCRGEGPAEGMMDRVRADSADRARRRSSTMAGGAVAVIPIYGILSQRGNLLDDVSGGGSTSTQMLTAALREAVADDGVGAILLDVDSGGGSVYGIGELGDEIFQARSKKPIVAVANSLAASAAYWLAAQCSEFYVTPGGECGSIGVVSAHTDYSGANEKAGVAITYIVAGQHKAEANPDSPLSAEALVYEQSRVDDYYASFTRAVARGRGTTVATVRGPSWGEGRVLGAKAAVDVKMADGVMTFDEALGRARQLAKQPRAAGAAAINPNTDSRAVAREQELLRIRLSAQS